MTTPSTVHQVTEQVNYSDVREGATWHLIPIPEDHVLKIVIDLPPDGKFDFGAPGYDNETIISLETLKKLVQRIEGYIIEHKFTFKPSHSCGWVIAPGSAIACGDANIGPWYCPQCGQTLDVRLEEEA